MYGDFVGEFEIARVQTVQKFLAFETLLREFGDVIVGIGTADLWLFCFAVGCDGREKNVLASDDRGRPAEAGNRRGPFDVGTSSTMCLGDRS